MSQSGACVMCFWRRVAQVLLWTGFLALPAGAQLPEPRTLRPQQEVTARPNPAEARVALVVGNGAYPEAPLKNPPQDARAMAQALEGCGFQVRLVLNANRDELFRAVREFGERIRGGGVGLFYYAGHGMAVRGANYLIPVGVDIATEDEVAVQGLDVNAVLGKMDAAKNRLNLLILDACRNNPFARSFRSASHGLTQMEAPSGTFVAFATAPGSTASDGQGENGLYTQYILQALQQPGLSVEQVFKQVRIAVKQASRDQQIPWDSSSLTGEFYFRPGPGSGAQVAHLPTMAGPALAAPPVASSSAGTLGPPSAQALTGNLQVAVIGAEARISLDAEFKGMARPEQPLNLVGLLPGEARLRAEAPGRLSVEQMVRIEPGKWIQVGLPMKKGMLLLLYRKPRWKNVHLEVFINDRKVAVLSNQDFIRTELPAGAYTLKIRTAEPDLIKGYQEAQLRIEPSPKNLRYFSVSAGWPVVLAEQTEEIWKTESVQFGSREIEVKK